MTVAAEPLRETFLEQARAESERALAHANEQGEAKLAAADEHGRALVLFVDLIDTQNGKKMWAHRVNVPLDDGLRKLVDRRLARQEQDAFAAESVKVERFYVQPVCSPSRAAPVRHRRAPGRSPAATATHARAMSTSTSSCNIGGSSSASSAASESEASPGRPQSASDSARFA